jgi:hypothetical protein
MHRMVFASPTYRTRAAKPEGFGELDRGLT